MKEHIQVEALWIWDQHPVLLNAILEGISSSGSEIRKPIGEQTYSRIKLNYEKFHLILEKEVLTHQMTLSNASTSAEIKNQASQFIENEFLKFKQLILKLPTKNSVIFEISSAQLLQDKVIVHLKLIKEISADKRTFPRFIGKLPTQMTPIQPNELQNHMQNFPLLSEKNSVLDWNVPDPIVNFSVGGLGLVTQMPVVVGQFVIIGFLDLYGMAYRRFVGIKAGHIQPQHFDKDEPPKSPDEFHAIGEVVRCKSSEVVLEDGSIEAIFEVGVNFLQIEDDAQELLEELTLSIQETTLPFARTSAK
jgi:hypothetical protein